MLKELTFDQWLDKMKSAKSSYFLFYYRELSERCQACEEMVDGLHSEYPEYSSRYVKEHPDSALFRWEPHAI